MLTTTLKPKPCECRQCIREADKGLPFFESREACRMILCVKCGNKRCPHANDHRNECTGSNDPGQPGSAYA